MVHLVYCDNAGKRVGQNSGRDKDHGHAGRKIPHSRVSRASAFISWKGERLHHGDWLIIEKIEDVVVGTSIPYNYEKSKFYTELQLKSLKKILIA